CAREVGEKFDYW
nr:immunoglobulin heavy chain junction region [Macaca mulatta]MOW98841.1 immunoglobulin heavy chain junction region [Macaca mulatta]MOW98854.1 immunoglobulin heavy chain junction region [Macaca mulatta]MOW99622.1 immunoglobulin heavy chain junction region [Macaca mulatta]MOW99762.1 immunoglobulin heavy chain junction region [Macaca mulatta]